MPQTKGSKDLDESLNTLAFNQKGVNYSLLTAFMCISSNFLGNMINSIPSKYYLQKYYIMSSLWFRDDIQFHSGAISFLRC